MIFNNKMLDEKKLKKKMRKYVIVRICTGLLAL